MLLANVFVYAFLRKISMIFRLRKQDSKLRKNFRVGNSEAKAIHVVTQRFLIQFYQETIQSDVQGFFQFL